MTPKSMIVWALLSTLVSFVLFIIYSIIQLLYKTNFNIQFLITILITIPIVYILRKYSHLIVSVYILGTINFYIYINKNLNINKKILTIEQNTSIVKYQNLELNEQIKYLKSQGFTKEQTYEKLKNKYEFRKLIKNGNEKFNKIYDEDLFKILDRNLSVNK